MEYNKNRKKSGDVAEYNEKVQLLDEMVMYDQSQPGMQSNQSKKLIVSCWTKERSLETLLLGTGFRNHREKRQNLRCLDIPLSIIQIQPLKLPDIQPSFFCVLVNTLLRQLVPIINFPYKCQVVLKQDQF